MRITVTSRLPEVGPVYLWQLSKDICYPHRPTHIFSAHFVLTRAHPGITFRTVTHPQIAPGQARLTSEFFGDRLPENKLQLVGMSILLILLSPGPGCHTGGGGCRTMWWRRGAGSRRRTHGWQSRIQRGSSSSITTAIWRPRRSSGRGSSAREAEGRRIIGELRATDGVSARRWRGRKGLCNLEGGGGRVEGRAGGAAQSLTLPKKPSPTCTASAAPSSSS